MNKKRLTVTDIYNESTLQNKVEYKLYKRIWIAFAKNLIDRLINSGKSYKLPKMLGTLQVIKKKTNKNSRKIDFQKTKQYGMTIYHTNKHSDGYYAMFLWNKTYPKGIFKNKKIFSLEMTRSNKRKLSHNVKHNNSINQYIEVY